MVSRSRQDRPETLRQGMLRPHRGARVRFVSFVSFVSPVAHDGVRMSQYVQTSRSAREVRWRIKRIVPEYASCFRQSRQGTAFMPFLRLDLISYCDHVADFDVRKATRSAAPGSVHRTSHRVRRYFGLYGWIWGGGRAGPWSENTMGPVETCSQQGHVAQLTTGSIKNARFFITGLPAEYSSPRVME
jgi:hypothetical protein